MEKLEELEKRIAALEKEQLLLREYTQRNLEMDRELIEIVKNFRKGFEEDRLEKHKKEVIR